MSDRLAQDTWACYQHARDRGHRQYVAQAARCERFYLGQQADAATGRPSGGQWEDADRARLYAARKPVLELNVVFPALNVAIGHQLNSRMEIAFRPRGGLADQRVADALAKVVKQVADRNQLQWLESQVWADGLIEQRGYYDVRMSFDNHLAGEIAVTVLDPRDVLPDPDASAYDPDGWRDVRVTRWLSLDEIEQSYGRAAAREVEGYKPEELDFGEEDDGRGKFGDAYLGPFEREDGSARQRPCVRVIDQQAFRWELAPVLLYPDGSVRDLPPGWDRNAIAETARATGAVVTRQHRKRVRWTVATRDVVLHDAWSPYPWLTVVGFFPYFRRGKTRGMVDNAVSPQELLNKSASSYLHIINTSANSGWVVQENSLSNLRTEDLEEKGAETGLVVEYQRGAEPPQKIAANPIPQGVDRLLERAEGMVKSITSISDAMQGLNGPEVSGIAIQSKQFMGQTSLAGPIDNLARTRHLLAQRLLDLVQRFYTDERVYQITEQGPDGRERVSPLVVNEVTPEGLINNDLTLGDYDVVVSSQPLQATFAQGQFTQGLELRKAGIAVPDHVLIKHSNLADKAEIIQAMQEQTDPLAEAEAAKLAAEVEKLGAERERVVAETANKAVEAQYSATQTAALLAQMPQVSAMADALLLSAGYEDRDAPPIVPAAPAAAPVPAGVLPQNTRPLTPANPGLGRRQGIETRESPG